MAPDAGNAAGTVAEGSAALGPWIDGCLARFERAARQALPPVTREPSRLHDAMRYAVLDGGKRVRPLLVYAAGEVGSVSAAALDAMALAVEYVHAYSLVHDDMPCMDDDVLRRGKPTVHVAYDEATAMLAGDALQAEAFRVLAAAPLPAPACVALIHELAVAISTSGMCGGQAIDLAAVGHKLDLAQLERMHRMKTGALLRASIRMPAIAAGFAGAAGGMASALDGYADAIGLAFQVVDDILDVEATSDELGKTAGKDARQNKPTYVSAIGLEAARSWAEDLRRQAHASLDGIAGVAGIAGAATARLHQLADMIVLRRS
ncbi:MAG TPA: farnesyl diphosphate synthase [Burkholderiaceae bacterium]|nr:farnesyl diphosphate synthase [Burkholderiaceae bacterium]